MKPFIALIALVMFSLLTVSNCTKNELEQKTQDFVIQDSLIIINYGVDSMNVLEILQQNHDVNTVSSGLGTFVKGIDNIENSAEAFWLYSVNDTIGDRASDSFITKSGDVIKWHYRLINQPDRLSDSVQ
jgi:hypothetical protein